MASRVELPIDLLDDVELPDHRVLRIRPLRRCDGDPVRKLYQRLSPRSRYLRFFSPMPALPDSMLRLITCVDHLRQVALVAELDLEEGRQVVAFGNFAANDEGAVEVALVVGDEWQRQGIGTILAGKMVQAAATRGFERYVAHTLWENSAAIRKLIRHVGEIVSGRSRAGVLELSFVRRQ
jgi:RimJ/RimL family protein N-acetyltransferase